MGDKLGNQQLIVSTNSKTKEFENLERVMFEQNCIVRLFLSGNRLRVVRVEKNNKTQELVNYGEDVNFIGAMMSAEIDCINNIKEYQAKCYVGNFNGDCNIDLWLAIGSKIFFYHEFGKVVAEARYFDGRVIFRRIGESLYEAMVDLEMTMSEYELCELSSGLIDTLDKRSHTTTEEQLLLSRKNRRAE